MAAAMVLVVGLLTIGFATGFGSEASAEPTVQAFLLDWQQGRYAQAAALTDGPRGQVSAQLAAAYSDLDASNTFFAMGPVTQHGSTAVASFKATVDLAEGEHQWSYTGRFTLTQKNGQWLVDWAPSVINPGLGPGDRLAVLTSFAPRAQVQDAAGQGAGAQLPAKVGAPFRLAGHRGCRPGRDGGFARAAGRGRGLPARRDDGRDRAPAGLPERAGGHGVDRGDRRERGRAYRRDPVGLARSTGCSRAHHH